MKVAPRGARHLVYSLQSRAFIGYSSFAAQYSEIHEIPLSVDRRFAIGLFDFVRNIGDKLFSRDDEAPQKIKEHIEAVQRAVFYGNIQGVAEGVAQWD